MPFAQTRSVFYFSRSQPPKFNATADADPDDELEVRCLGQNQPIASDAANKLSGIGLELADTSFPDKSKKSLQLLHGWVLRSIPLSA